MAGPDPARELLVYSRAGCHLCEDLLERVEPLCRAAGVALRVLDVDADAGWRAAYGTRVPVVVGEGRELGAGRPDLLVVERWLLQPG